MKYFSTPIFENLASQQREGKKKEDNFLALSGQIIFRKKKWTNNCNFNLPSFSIGLVRFRPVKDVID